MFTSTIVRMVPLLVLAQLWLTPTGEAQAGSPPGEIACEDAADFELYSQRELRDCYPVTLLMVLRHLGKLHEKHGGQVLWWPDYETVKSYTHESDLARGSNPNTRMVHGEVGLWAANELASKMGLPWKFEARIADDLDDLADSLSGGLPVIVTWTTKVMSRPMEIAGNVGLDVLNGPGNIVKGVGEVVEVIPLVGIIGKPFKWFGKKIKPAKLIVPEGNIYTRYLHASALLRIDRSRGLYTFANPWAGLLPKLGKGEIMSIPEEELRSNFLRYGTRGEESGQVLREWEGLARPGSHLVPIPR